MATLNEAREAIYARWNTMWNTGDAVFIFENEDFENRPDDAPWIRLGLRHRDSDQDTLGEVGNRKYLRQASIFIQIYTLVTDGLQSSDNLVTLARNIFEGATFSGVACFDAVNREIGPNGNWYQVNIEVFIQYEEVK